MKSLELYFLRASFDKTYQIYFTDILPRGVIVISPLRYSKKAFREIFP